MTTPIKSLGDGIVGARCGRLGGAELADPRHAAVAKVMSVRWLTYTEERLLRQHRQHRLRPCFRVDGCRLGLHLLDRAAVGSTDDRDPYRGRC
jgi:hypothetical protein